MSFKTMEIFSHFIYQYLSAFSIFLSFRNTCNMNIWSFIAIIHYTILYSFFKFFSLYFFRVINLFIHLVCSAAKTLSCIFFWRFHLQNFYLVLLIDFVHITYKLPHFFSLSICISCIAFNFNAINIFLIPHEIFEIFLQAQYLILETICSFRGLITPYFFIAPVFLY